MRKTINPAKFLPFTHSALQAENRLPDLRNGTAPAGFIQKEKGKPGAAGKTRISAVINRPDSTGVPRCWRKSSKNNKHKSLNKILNTSTVK